MTSAVTNVPVGGKYGIQLTQNSYSFIGIYRYSTEIIFLPERNLSVRSAIDSPELVYNVSIPPDHILL